MRHDTRQYLATLNAETLITIIEGLCGFGGFDVNHGADPSDGKPIVYGSHHLHGTFTLANVDEKAVPKWEMGEARFVCNNNMNRTDNGCGCKQDPPCLGCVPEKYRGFYATIQYYDEDESKYVFICNSQQMENDATDDGHVFYYYDGTPEKFMKDYGADRGRGCSDWYAVAVEGVSPPPEPNRLHLYKVYTIDDDLVESDPVFVMARSEDGAACLYHKARARDLENIICEVIVDKVQDAEVCDE